MTERERIYNIWYDMKERCYVETCTNWSRYGGRGVTVCSEWLNVNNFREWYLQNSYDVPEDRLSLDKDLCGGKLYSPNTCVLIPSKLNSCLITGYSDIAGCQLQNGKWRVKVRNSISGKRECVGTYDSIEKAISAYKTRKTEILHELTNEYINIIPKHVYELLISYSF